MATPELQRRNARLGWILASLALLFALGFVVRLVWFGR
jgi:hypothetical protein